ncbi:MAG: hypothetical protein HND48_23360 [Chloroflexi bacterium]|nr:hypothetical protein [Chloroflexota bacterium]
MATPEYCRLTRVIRDIPGTDIVDGNKLTNFRQVVERHLAAQAAQPGYPRPRGSFQRRAVRRPDAG